MIAGVVKWFDPVRGYGWIVGQPDVFVHFRAIRMDGFKTLGQGQRVMYELAIGERGVYASVVIPLQ